MNVIVRTQNAGVFAGIAEGTQLDTLLGDNHTIILTQARRLWYWSGAATLSELATKGVANPHQCKFPAPVHTILLTEVIEVIPTTPEAEASIAAVPTWTAR